MGVVYLWPCQKLTKAQDEGSGGSASLGCGPVPSARILPGGGAGLPHHDAVEQIEKPREVLGGGQYEELYGGDQESIGQVSANRRSRARTTHLQVSIQICELPHRGG